MLEEMNKPGFLPERDGFISFFNDMLTFIPKDSLPVEQISATASYWDGKQWIPLDDLVINGNKLGNPSAAKSMGM